MPNALTSTGLTLATQAELVATLQAAFEAIYGADINLGSDTPDGQLLNIFVQMQLDAQDLMMQIYNMFDPDNAVGVVLDQRVAINGIERQGGSYTITNVTIVTSQSVNLYGLDQTTNAVFTVADNAGNLWNLITTVIATGVGTFSYAFQAAVIGAVLTVPNTIVVPVTIVLGITSINNPSTYTTLGVNQESDANLKLRRQQSVSLSSQGYLAGLLAALENIPGVTFASVEENNTGITNGDLVPGHSIWVIVAGSAASSAIANAIYTKRNAGCGMYGGTSYNITQIDGTIFTVYYDVVVLQSLFIAFTVSGLNGTTAPNIAAITAGIVDNFTPGVYAQVNINDLATVVQQADPNTLVTNAGFSPGTIQTLNLSGVPASGSIVIEYNGSTTSSLPWNDAASTIQIALQLLPGLSLATVSGSFAGKQLVFTLPSTVDSLLFLSMNSLMTSVPAAITASWDEGYTNTLIPSQRNYQFQVTEQNIIILPMQMSPPSATAVHSGSTITFVGLGGFGTYAYALTVNNSGGSMNATTGVYTPGSTPNVSDTIKVTDSFGNTATAVITVT